jgi:hypothetical protein
MLSLMRSMARRPRFGRPGSRDLFRDHGDEPQPSIVQLDVLAERRVGPQIPCKPFHQ